MPIYKCPEGDYQSVFDENQRKISEFHQKENGISANQNKPQKRYAFLKTLEHSVKYLFRNFFKILFIMLGYKSGSKTYILFVLFGGVGDLIREKSIVCELIKMSPRVVIDLVWKKKKAYPFFCEIKNIRFYLYLTQPLFRLIKKRYDIVYTCQHDKPEMVKIEFINENKKLAAYIKENIKKYETVKSANSNHFICSYKKAAGVDNIYDKT
ncbi:MAG: hypothetical protein LBH29_07350, partial [Elusimicrobiota bacterium]|nr:hypothetical protein [Elusimicrobiota bacterium]